MFKTHEKLQLSSISFQPFSENDHMTLFQTGDYTLDLS